MSQEEIENRLLTKISFITNIGNFFTEFASVVLVYRLKQDALLVGFGAVGVGSLATIVSDIAIPHLARIFNTRTLIIISQAISALAVFLLLLLAKLDLFTSPWQIFLIGFTQGFMTEIFSVARETHSHGMSDEKTDHKLVQAIIQKGIQGAQFVGPLAVFLLLKTFDPSIPIVVDVVTFLFAIYFAFQLKETKFINERIAIWRPLSYLGKKWQLLKLFLLRTVGFWIPCSLFNLLLFENISGKYLVGMEYSALIYSILGLGGLLSAASLGKKTGERSNFFSRQPTYEIAFWSHVIFAVSTLGLILTNSIYVGLFLYLAVGFTMGLNRVATQAMRRELCNKEQFPEVVALESIVGFGIQFIMSAVVLTYLKRFPNFLEFGLAIAAISWFVVGFAYRSNWKK